MGKTWAGIIGYEGLKTGDGRYIEPGALKWGSLPMPLRYVTQDNGAHDGAQVAGHVLRIERLEPNEQGIVGIWAAGDFDDDSELGKEAARQVEKQLTTGVSMDLDDVAFEVRREEMSKEAKADRLRRMLSGEGESMGREKGDTMVTTGARIRAITQVAIPAFEGARIGLASDTAPSATPGVEFTASDPANGTQTVLASGAVLALGLSRQEKKRAERMAAVKARTLAARVAALRGEKSQSFSYNPMELRDPENGQWIDSPTKAFKEISDIAGDLHFQSVTSDSQFHSSLSDLQSAGENFDSAVTGGDIDQATSALSDARDALSDMQNAAQDIREPQTADSLRSQLADAQQGISTLQDPTTLDAIIQQASNSSFAGDLGKSDLGKSDKAQDLLDSGWSKKLGNGFSNPDGYQADFDGSQLKVTSPEGDSVPNALGSPLHNSVDSVNDSVAEHAASVAPAPTRVANTPPDWVNQRLGDLVPGDIFDHPGRPGLSTLQVQTVTKNGDIRATSTGAGLSSLAPGQRVSLDPNAQVILKGGPTNDRLLREEYDAKYPSPAVAAPAATGIGSLPAHATGDNLVNSRDLKPGDVVSHPRMGDNVRVLQNETNPSATRQRVTYQDADGNVTTRSMKPTWKTQVHSSTQLGNTDGTPSAPGRGVTAAPRSTLPAGAPANWDDMSSSEKDLWEERNARAGARARQIVNDGAARDAVRANSRAQAAAAGVSAQATGSTNPGTEFRKGDSVRAVTADTRTGHMRQVEGRVTNVYKDADGNLGSYEVTDAADHTHQVVPKLGHSITAKPGTRTETRVKAAATRAAAAQSRAAGRVPVDSTGTALDRLNSGALSSELGSMSDADLLQALRYYLAKGGSSSLISALRQAAASRGLSANGSLASAGISTFTDASGNPVLVHAGRAYELSGQKIGAF